MEVLPQPPCPSRATFLKDLVSIVAIGGSFLAPSADGAFMFFKIYKFIERLARPMFIIQQIAYNFKYFFVIFDDFLKKFEFFIVFLLYRE